MPRQKYQFTIRQLRRVIFDCAFLFLMLPLMSGVAFIITFVWIVVGFLVKRGVGGAGILGATIAVCIFSVGLAVASLVQGYFFGKPGALDGLGPGGALVAESACGLIFGATFCAILYLNFELPKRYINSVCPTDASCGPIVWHRFDDPRDSASSLK
jgi:hypothetical protein